MSNLDTNQIGDELENVNESGITSNDATIELFYINYVRKLKEIKKEIENNL